MHVPHQLRIDSSLIVNLPITAIMKNFFIVLFIAVVFCSTQCQTSTRDGPATTTSATASTTPEETTQSSHGEDYDFSGTKSERPSDEENGEGAPPRKIEAMWRNMEYMAEKTR